MLNIALWIVQVVLLGMFGYSGYLKLTKAPADIAKMIAWAADVPPRFLRFIGAVDLAGALGVILPILTGILPWLTPLAALGLVVLQVLAIAYHARRGETKQTIGINLALLAGSAFVLWGRWALFGA